MTQIYSTEELIKILADERRACINGQRLNLAATPSGINPLIDRFIQTEGFQKFTAYDNFRKTVHQYQQEHQVSGIVWQYLTIGDKTLHFPRVDEQLISLPTDLQILRAARASIVVFWEEVTVGMDRYLSMQGGKFHQPVAEDDIQRILHRTEWANLSSQGRGEALELILQLGWGKPEAAVYRRGFPESGSEYLHAVYPGRVPLG